MLSYKQFISQLADREYFGQKLGLERIASFLEKLGNPQNAYSVIHIAGTNGKGSTAAMLAAVLQSAGYRVGLYTSPHLEDFCERIQVNHVLISPEEIIQMAARLQELERKETVEKEGEQGLTFFEFTTALAFQYFAEQKVEVAVIEVGLGGRLDATNIVIPLVSVITSIGLDHQKFLGDTIEKIAFEKAGIIKPDVPVVIGQLPQEAERVVQDIARKNQTHVFVHGSPLAAQDLGLKGNHQKINAGMVEQVVKLLNQSGRFKICPPDLQKGLATVQWPGRLETLSEKPWILLDGAHNAEAMEHVVDYLKLEKKGRKVVCLFGAMGDKNVDVVMDLLTSVVDEFVFTQIDSERALKAETLKSRFGKNNSKTYQSVSEALQSVLQQLSLDSILLVTGSFYIVGEARTWLKNYSQ